MVPDPGILDEDRAEPFVAGGPRTTPMEIPPGMCLLAALGVHVFRLHDFARDGFLGNSRYSIIRFS